MRINLIVAMDRNQGIGFQDRLPWHLPDDLRRFKQLTMGHTLIMGRVTFESIGKPLPGREIIILTRDPDYVVNGCLVAHSLPQALNLAAARNARQVFICGGANVYQAGLQVAERLYLTQIHAEFQVDTHFPNWDPSQWKKISCQFHEVDQKHQHPFSFSIYKRIKP